MQRLLRQYGGWDTKLRNSVFKSFRFEIVLYSLLSLFYTLLTEAGFYFGFYIIKVLIKDSKEKTISKSELLQNTDILTNNTKIPAKIPKREPQMLILLGAIAIVIGIGLFMLYFLLLTKRSADYLKEIAVDIVELSTGNFKARVEIKSEDEFGLIADELNKMAAKISRIMEEERKSEQAKNELITSVAHDLRTPLTSIIGYLELASSKKGIEEEVRQRYITIAYEKSKRLEKLIEDLFNYTKVNFGQVKMNLLPIDMIKFMEQMMDEFYPSFQENHLEYDFTTNVGSAVVMGDGDLLARAISNLLGNAVKYGRDGKRIRVKVKQENEFVKIFIINYGEIIPEEDIEYIFDRFYRVENSRSRETGGSGLGLAIAKRVILMHQGTIQAKSNLDGTVFEVILPSNKEQKGEQKVSIMEYEEKKGGNKIERKK